MAKKTRYTVIGAGPGGKTMAAHLARMGFRTTLFNRTAENVADIKARGGIELMRSNGKPRGFGKLALVTSDMEHALAEAGVVMVVVPATAHADVARFAARFLHDGQIVVLNPGRFGGALEFSKVLEDEGCAADVTVAEAASLLYECRSEGPANVRILSIKQAIPLAAFPAKATKRALKALAKAYPQFIDGQTVLHTGLNNIEAIFNPALSILNAGRIEQSDGEFQLYLEGVTDSVGKVLESLDRERVTIASALGIRARTAMEWLKVTYGAVGGTLHQAIHNQDGYVGVNAPGTLVHRYITEDIPMNMVPIALLGARYGFSVRAMDCIIRLACVGNQTDYWQRGRTLDKLGISHLSVSEVMRYVIDGIV